MKRSSIFSLKSKIKISYEANEISADTDFDQNTNNSDGINIEYIVLMITEVRIF